MDIEKLIERLKEPDCDECTYEEKRECAGSAKCVLSGYAAEALSTLQAENARLREELEYEREHANAYHEECGQWEAENEKLRAELEQVKRERDAAIRDLRYLGDCVTCKYNKAPCPREDIGHKNCFQWRGQKEE